MILLFSQNNCILLCIYINIKSFFMSSLYIQVAEKIRENAIVSGLLAGGKLESLSEIQEKYNVSKITAIKAVDELEKAGFAKKIHGKGVYLKENAAGGALASGTPPVRQAVLAANENMLMDKNSFGGEIFRGAAARLDRRGASRRFEIPAQMSQYCGDISPALNLRAGDGVILQTSGDMSGVIGWLTARLLNSWVLIDSAAIGARCVLSDNRQGMRDLFSFLTRSGHKKFIFASGFSNHVCQFNLNERRETLEDEASRLNLELKVFDGVDFQELTRLAKNPRSKPDCILFPQDTPALNCIEHLERAGLKVPQDISVCGFDDISSSGKELARLTTVRVNTRKLGETAADTLFEPHKNPQSVFPWKRVKTELVVRQSVKIKKGI